MSLTCCLYHEGSRGMSTFFRVSLRPVYSETWSCGKKSRGGLHSALPGICIHAAHIQIVFGSGMSNDSVAGELATVHKYKLNACTGRIENNLFAFFYLAAQGSPISRGHAPCIFLQWCEGHGPQYSAFGRVGPVQSFRSRRWPDCGL
jgi:hypothetical protein